MEGIVPSAVRRNVFTRNVDLNEYIGQHFEVQGVRFYGSEESRPCDWMNRAILERRDGELEDYRRLAPSAQRNHPTDEHLLPLFVAYGAGSGLPERLHASQTFGILRMDAYAFP